MCSRSGGPTASDWDLGHLRFRWSRARQQRATASLGQGIDGCRWAYRAVVGLQWNGSQGSGHVHERTEVVSLEQHAFLSREHVPSAATWQAAISELGYDFTIDPELKPFEDSGFVPCSLGGESTGFEIYYQPAWELLREYSQLKDRIGSRDYSITFRWGGDLAEVASVLIASAALAKSFDAVVFYPDDDLFYRFDGLVNEIGSALEGDDGHDQAPPAPPEKKSSLFGFLRRG